MAGKAKRFKIVRKFLPEKDVDINRTSKKKESDRISAEVAVLGKATSKLLEDTKDAKRDK